MTKTSRRALPLAIAAAAVALFAGCEAKPTANGWSPASPELDTLANSSKEVDAKMQRSLDLGRRMIAEDFARAAFIDRPSRLMNKPAPY